MDRQRSSKASLCRFESCTEHLCFHKLIGKAICMKGVGVIGSTREFDSRSIGSNPMRSVKRMVIL